MKRHAGQILKYALAGGVAALVDLGGFAALVSLGVHLALAALVSFLVATVVNYRLSARFVFERRPSAGGYGRFLLGACGGLIVNVGATVLVAELVRVAPIASKIVGIGLAFLFNYAVNAAFVFRGEPRD